MGFFYKRGGVGGSGDGRKIRHKHKIVYSKMYSFRTLTPKKRGKKDKKSGKFVEKLEIVWKNVVGLLFQANIRNDSNSSVARKSVKMFVFFSPKQPLHIKCTAERAEIIIGECWMLFSLEKLFKFGVTWNDIQVLIAYLFYSCGSYRFASSFSAPFFRCFCVLRLASERMCWVSCMR